MKLFKKPHQNYSKIKYALIHGLFYGGISTIIAFVLIVILSATPSHLKLWQDWVIIGVSAIIIFLVVFLYVFFDELYIDKKFKEESKKSNKENISKNPDLKNKSKTTK